MTNWEVWYANVAFEEDSTKSKKRPVVVIDNRTAIILSLKVTSHEPRQNVFGEYALQRWKEAGLVKPSTVRCSKRLSLDQKDFVQRIGRLHPIDIYEIQKILKGK
jgi:mRNA-degrading endonuclease toxin of MazEF toxin-antitoxin module